MILIVEILLSVAIAGLIHELGHYLTALTFGHHLVFRRQGFRFIWDMPKRHTTTSATYSTGGIWVRDNVLSVALFCRSVAVSVGSCGTSDGLSVLCGGVQ